MLYLFKNLKNIYNKICHVLVRSRNQIQGVGSTLYHFRLRAWVVKKISAKENKVDAWRSSTLKLVFVYLTMITVVLGVGNIMSHYMLSISTLGSREFLWLVLFVIGAIVIFLVSLLLYLVYMEQPPATNAEQTPELIASKVTRTLNRWCLWSLFWLVLVGLFFFFDYYVIKDPIVFSFSNLQLRKVWWSDYQLVSMGRQYLNDQLLVYHRSLNFFTTSDISYIATKAEGALKSMIDASNNDLDELRRKLDVFLQRELKELQDVRCKQEINKAVHSFLGEVIPKATTFFICTQIIFSVLILVITHTLK